MPSSVDVLDATELHIKMAKMVDFMGFFFYHTHTVDET